MCGEELGELWGSCNRPCEGARETRETRETFGMCESGMGHLVLPYTLYVCLVTYVFIVIPRVQLLAH